MTWKFLHKRLRPIGSKTPQPKNSPGFTLLEVLIVMGILVFISFSIFQAITQTFYLRDSLSREGKFYSRIRITHTIMNRDFIHLYSPLAFADPRTLFPQPNAPASRQEIAVIMNQDLSVGSEFWLPALDESGLRPSRFQGKATSVSFISASHTRIYKDKPETEFSKISYELDPDNALIRTEDPSAFDMDDRTETSRKYEILTDVTKLEFTYHQRDGEGWKTFKTWDTEAPDFRNKYPDYIEMKFEISNKEKRLYYEGLFRFKPEIPFNGVPTQI